MNNIYKECGNTSPSKELVPQQSCRMRKRKDRKDYKATGKMGSPFKQELELVKRSSDLSFNGL